MQRNVHSGFTLLEILISVGILATVAVLMTQVLFTTTHVNKKTELLNDIKQNGNFTLDVIGRMVRSAIDVETTCDTGPTATVAARIRSADGYETIFMCMSDGNVARIASVSATGAATYLTGGNVTLSTSGAASCSDSSLSFSCPSASGVQSQLSITFTLGQPGIAGSTYENGSASFQSTVMLRN